MNTDVETRVGELLAEVLSRPELVHIDTNLPLLDTVPELDSFSVINLIERISAEFNLEFEDDDLTEETFFSISTLAKCIKEKIT